MKLLLLLAVVALGGCAAMEPPVTDLTKGACRNEGLDRFIGQKATAALGTQMLAASGAKQLRWGAPGMMMTMDVRGDRLTVRYDDAMVVTGAQCG